MAQRQEIEQQIQGKQGTGLRLPDERLAGPDGRIPKREMPGMDFPRLELEARDLYVAHVGMVKPDVLIGEDELPIETDRE